MQRSSGSTRRQLAWLVGMLLVGSVCVSQLRAQSLLPPPARLPEDSDLSRIPDQALPESSPSDEHYVLIQNRSDQPLEYQALRSNGTTWTKTYTLPPGMSHKYVFDVNQARARFATLGYYGKNGYVIVRFPAAGGWVVQKLIANTPYAYVQDSNGFGYIAEPRNGKILASNTPDDPSRQIALLTYNHAFETKEEAPAPAPQDAQPGDKQAPATPAPKSAPKKSAPRQQAKPSCRCQ